MPSSHPLTREEGLPTSQSWTWLIAVLIFAAALALRLYRLGDWSLWLDEEATIYMSQNLEKPFARSAPLYFHSLNAFFSMTGITVWAGRAFSVVLGVATIGVMATAFRSYVSPTTALLAAAFLSVSVGHLYWSQNVRYYTATLFFETVAIACFLHGFERSRLTLVILSNVMWVCALGCHLTAVLLAPVFWLYLAWAALWEKPSPYRRRDYIAFFLCQLFIVCVIGVAILTARGRSLNVLGVSPQGQSMGPTEDDWALKLAMTVAAYFGLPVVMLGLTGMFLKTSPPSRAKMFFAFCALLPLVELLVLRQFHFIHLALWYYGFVSVIGFCYLAAMSIESLIKSNHRRIAFALAALSFTYYGAFVVYYWGPMYGDRPRWAEATQYVKERVGGVPLDKRVVMVWSTAPNVVEFYLGVAPTETMHEISVQALLYESPPLVDVSSWYLVDEGRLKPPVAAFLQEHCDLKTVFKAHSGPRDRSVRIYYRDGQGG